MNKLNPVVLALTLCAASLTLADDEHRTDHHKGGGEMESADGMTADDTMQKGMKERMQAMRETMQKIQDAQDPAQRRQLMQEHMQQMHDAMGEMGRMGHHGEGMKGDRMKMDGKRCQRMMKMHAGMMQKMMEQMGAHMQASGHQQGN